MQTFILAFLALNLVVVWLAVPWVRLITRQHRLFTEIEALPPLSDVLDHMEEHDPETVTLFRWQSRLTGWRKIAWYAWITLIWPIKWPMQTRTLDAMEAGIRANL